MIRPNSPFMTPILEKPADYLLKCPNFWDILNTLRAHGKSLFIYSCFGREWLEKVMTFVTNVNEWEGWFNIIICHNR